MRTLVAVVGCHRSGTSAAAGALAQLGLDLGQELMPPSPANPRGYWESMPVVRVHEELLRRKGLTWDAEVLPPWEPLKWADTRARVRLVHALGQSRGDVFALKDPRMCLFPDLWMEAADWARVRLVPLYVCRQPSAIVKSLQARDSFNQRHAVEVVHAYMAGVTRWRGLMGGAVLSYEGLLADPSAELGAALQGVCAGVSTEQLEAVKSFLDPELNHHG